MIAPAVPAQTGNGLAMRLGVFLEALSEVAEVDLAVLPVAGGAAKPSPLMERLGIRSFVISCSEPDTHFALLWRLKDPQARLEAFLRYGRPRLCAGLSAPVLRQLLAVTAGRNYALVHVGRAYLAPAAHGWAGSGAALSLDLDEDDYETANSIARLYSRAGRSEAGGWQAAEAVAFDRLIGDAASLFDWTWISSPLDRRSVKARHPRLDPIVIPNTVAKPQSRPHSDDGRTLLFVGAFGYAPNADAALWFARSVWPTLQANSATPPRLLLVGADAPAEVWALDRRPGITVMGPRADLRSLYARTTLALVPLRAGGGTKIKLLEAASHSVPVITTSIGAAGLPIGRFRCGWIADGAERFAAACLSALESPAERRRRGKRGRMMVDQEFDRRRAVRRLACTFAGCLSKRTAYGAISNS